MVWLWEGTSIEHIAQVGWLAHTPLSSIGGGSLNHCPDHCPAIIYRTPHSKAMPNSGEMAQSDGATPPPTPKATGPVHLMLLASGLSLIISTPNEPSFGAQPAT